MSVKKVLFVCVHNSARSQMGEAYMNKLAEGRYIAESAGLESGELNPYVVKAMQEDGIDISGSSTNEVLKYYQEGRIYHYVIRVCDVQAAERCPVFPDILESFHWDVRDPSSFKGTDEEILENTRQIRNDIKERVTDWLKEH